MRWEEGAFSCYICTCLVVVVQPRSSLYTHSETSRILPLSGNINHMVIFDFTTHTYNLRM